MVGHMVSVGEETGQLETMLGKVADFYEAEVDAKVKALTALLEPIMIVFVGGIVGFIVISMYLPIDRKSTRLNSSHPSISYAVFCLKKKKNNNITMLFTI